MVDDNTNTDPIAEVNIAVDKKEKKSAATKIKDLAKSVVFKDGKLRRGVVIAGLGVAAAAAVYWGVSLRSNYIDRQGTVVFDGPIEGVGRVTYTENVGRGDDERNILEVRNGQESFALVDTDATPLKWDDPSVCRLTDTVEACRLTDTVEIVSYRDENGNVTYERAQIGNRTYAGSQLGDVFVKADLKYNTVRKRILQEKRAEVNENLAKIKAALK